MSDGGRTMRTKLLSLDDLAKVAESLKRRGKRIVHCHGVFDLVHPGHLRHFEAARREGDVLVVTLTPDEHVNKGPGRPVFNQNLRADVLAALQCVDYVAINRWPTAVETIHLLRPSVYVKGGDYARRENDLTGKILEEEAAVHAVGGRIHFTDDITFSSTQLLNAHFAVFPPETDAYLREFRRVYSADTVIERLRSLESLRVLVVGDAIVDEYHFCNAYGMASKSAAIAARFQRAEAYAGGALAVANHLAGFCREVHLVTCLGEQDSREQFIRAALRPNVRPQFFFRPDAPTIVKRRYVHEFLVMKLFEVSFANDQLLPAGVDQGFRDHLDEVAGQYDLVVVADFGHGLISPGAVERLVERASYLAVNTQLNSMNAGYNVATKYRRADYLCIDEEEARLAARERYGALESVMEQLGRDVGCRIMTVTRGQRGSVTYHRAKGLVSTPALSREVVDTVGAGDAYLAITALAARADLPPDLVGFIGNAVSALAVRVVGNKEAVEPLSVFRFISALLK